MDAISHWYWRRFQKRFFFALFVSAVLMMVVALMVPLAFIVHIAWGLSLPETALWSLVSIGGGIFAAAAGPATCVAVRRPITAWINGDRDHAEDARDAILVAGERMAMRAGLVGGPVMLATSAPLLSHFADFSLAGYVAVELMGIAALALAANLMATALRIFFRPVLVEVGDFLPIDGAPRQATWTLRTVLSANILISAAAAGSIAAAVAQYFDNTREHALLAGAIAAGLLGVYGAAINRLAFVQPVLRPLEDLRQATRRVGAGDFSRPVRVTSTDEFGQLAISFNSMMIGLQQRAALHSAFGSYVDPALAERLLQQDGSEFAGEAVHATVFFADVRGFTNYAETVEPAAAVARLNELFNIVVPAIGAAGGHTNRYIGDGVLAVFGTPERLDNHAQHALAAAVTIQREVRKTFGEDLRLGIGMNSGDMIAGTIGGGGKLDFTVIGDAVNVAARVEELTKETGDRILLTQDTLDLLRAAPNLVTNRGLHTMRGREHPVQLYAVDV